MKSANQLVSEANQQIETLTPDEAIKLAANENVVFVDLREPDEVQKDSLPGAVHVLRGLLEFQIDPQSPSYNA